MTSISFDQSKAFSWWITMCILNLSTAHCTTPQPPKSPCYTIIWNVWYKVLVFQVLVIRVSWSSWVWKSDDLHLYSPCYIYTTNWPILLRWHVCTCRCIQLLNDAKPLPDGSLSANQNLARLAQWLQSCSRVTNTFGCAHGICTCACSCHFWHLYNVWSVTDL